MAQRDLIILETVQEAQKWVMDSNGENTDLRRDILALHPNIRTFLKKHQIDSLSTTEFMDGPAFRKMMDQCWALESYIRKDLQKQEVPEPDEYFINAFWHFLRLIWRHLFWNIILLEQCLERGTNDRLLAFQYNRVITHSPWIEDDQLYMGEIARRLCRDHGVEFIPLAPPPLEPRPLPEKAAGSVYKRWCNRLAFVAVRLTATLLAGKKTLLVPSFKYNMNRVCQDLTKKDHDLKIGIFYLGKEGAKEVLQALAILAAVLSGKKIPKPSLGYPIDFAFPIMTAARFQGRSFRPRLVDEYIEATIKAIEKGKNRETVFVGVELADLLMQKIHDDLTPYLLEISYQAFGLDQSLELFKPKWVVSQMTGEIYGALGRSAKELGIPSVLISHGSHVHQADQYAAREHDILARNILVGDYEYCAVQSPLAREMALFIGKEPEKIVNIPPTLWGTTVNHPPRKGEGLTIVHAGTLKLRHNRRYFYETSDEFLLGLTELIEAVAPFPQLRLILKIRPDIYELSLETMQELLPQAGNVVIEADQPFLEVLKEADLVVSFSSTTIEEALNNEVPVLLYGGSGRYAHIPVEPFSVENGNICQAVTFVTGPEELKQYMEQLNILGPSFHVLEEAFTPYRFNREEVVDLTSWILSLGKAA